MPATIPTSTVRPQSERNASPTARAPSRRSQREPTPKTTRTGVALRGRIPARPAARIPAATKSSGWRNFCAPRASRKPPGQTRMGFVGNWGGRTRTSNFPVNSRAVCQLTYTPLRCPKQRAPPDPFRAGGARSHNHHALRRPGPQIQEIGVTIAICVQTGERPHRAYTLPRPLPPSKGRAHGHMPPNITSAAPADLPAILALLAASKLPRASIEDHVASTLVARQDSGIVGTAALELYGGAALLRSVAVATALRGQGLGAALTVAALDLAQRRGVRTVYLLTETAGQFFPKFGFTAITRAQVEPVVLASLEFTTACPKSALVMVKQL